MYRRLGWLTSLIDALQGKGTEQMPAPANKVTVEISGGPSQDITWTSNMTAQDALELAWNAINSTAKFTFGLQYYGASLGYMVFMINETFDSTCPRPSLTFIGSFWSMGQPNLKGSTGLHLRPGMW